MKTKNKTVAILLALFLGDIGIHKFYLGQAGQGIIYLLLCWTFIPVILSIIDIIHYLLMSEGDFQTKYGGGYVANPQQIYQQPSQQQFSQAQSGTQGGFVFCSSCGTKVVVGTKYCPNCGNQIN